MLGVWKLVLYRVYVRVTMIQNIKVKNICIVSQKGSLEILVRMAIPTRTTFAGGYSHAHKTLIFGLHFCVRGLATRTYTLYKTAAWNTPLMTKSEMVNRDS